jgi:uncharacterized protein YqeY
MLLKEKINLDFIEAYKAKEMEKKNFLGVLKGAIQTQEGKMVESTNENVLKIIKSFEKSIKETIEAKVKLDESTLQQEMELSYLSPYMPVLMSEADILVIVKEILARPDINKNQGFLIGTFNKENTGKAFDNKLVMKLIQEEIKCIQ